MRAAPLLASLTVTAVGLAAAGPAAADPAAIATDAPKPARRLDTRLGLLLGGGDIGDVTGPATGVHASLGYRLGGVTMMGEYDYLGVGDSSGDATSRDGRMTRGGGTVRWAIADVAPRDAPLGLEFWVEGGAGVERVSWSKGGLLYRPDATLGFGFEVDGRGWRSPEPRHFGLYLAFRAVLARAPATDAPAMCEGPCTEATPPSRNDVSLFFHMGLHWGR